MRVPKKCGESISPYRELSIGETIHYRTADGLFKEIALMDASSKSCILRVNSTEREIILSHFKAPSVPLNRGEVLGMIETEGVRIGVEVTRSFMRGSKYDLSFINLRKDVRIWVIDAGKPLSPPGPHLFPLQNFQWNYGDNWLVPCLYGFHLGIDIIAPSGHPVVSATSGKIVAVRNLTGQKKRTIIWGNMVAIHGEDGFLYCYTHCDEFAKNIEEGKVIGVGETIGPVGRSGFEKTIISSHLHFDMLVVKRPHNFSFTFELEPDVMPVPNMILAKEPEGYVVNPYPYLMEWYLSQENYY